MSGACSKKTCPAPIPKLDESEKGGGNKNQKEGAATHRVTEYNQTRAVWVDDTVRIGGRDTVLLAFKYLLD